MVKASFLQLMKQNLKTAIPLQEQLFTLFLTTIKKKAMQQLI